MRHIACFLLGIAAILASLPAFAQSCLPRDALVARLEAGYGETVRARGLASTGGVVEMFVAPSGSWTLAITTPDGTACLIAAGTHAEMLAPVEGDPA